MLTAWLAGFGWTPASAAAPDGERAVRVKLPGAESTAAVPKQIGLAHHDRRAEAQHLALRHLVESSTLPYGSLLFSYLHSPLSRLNPGAVAAGPYLRSGG